MAVSFSGLSSGLNTDKIIASLLQIERQPIQRYESRIEETKTTQGAYRDLNNRVSNLLDKVDSLADSDTWDQLSVNSSDSSVVGVSITDKDKAAEGTYEVYVEQLATQARLSSGQVINNQVTFDNDAAHDVSGDAYSGGKASKSYFEVVEGSGELDLDSTSYLNQLSKSVSTSGDSTAEWRIDDETSGWDVPVDLDKYNTFQSMIDDVNSQLNSVEFGYDSSEDKFYFQANDTDGDGGTSFRLDDDNGYEFLTKTGVTGDTTIHTFSENQATAGSNVISADSSANLEDVLFTNSVDSSGTISVAGESISWDASSDSINSIVQKISEAENGVTASYSDLSDKITLQTENTGTGEIEVTDESGNLAEVLNLEDGSVGGQAAGDSTAGQSAKLKINGETVYADGNTVETQGLTLNLKDLYKESNNSGDPIQITVKQDTASTQKSVEEFVAQYNSVVEFINKKSSINVPSEPGEETGESGPFVGKSIPRQVKATLNRLVTDRYENATAADSKIQSIADIGIETVDPTLAADSDVGKLKFDSSEFQSKLDSDEQGVRSLFNADTSEGDSADGIATELQSYLNDATDSSNGILPERIDSFDTRIDNLQERIEDQEDHVQAKKEQLEQRFLQMEQMMADLNQQQQALSSNL